MACVTDPENGLEFYELSHPWGMYTPIFPGYEEIKLERITYHAKQGVMTHKITTIFHTSTHVNAPLHLLPGREGVGELALQRFFGTGVVLPVSKGKWETIEPADLEAAAPAVEPGDIVLINTGWHRRYSDSKEYFGYAPGLSKRAAEWLVERRVKLVGVDTATIDHPLATSIGPHRNGPQIKYLLPEYRQATGREAIAGVTFSKSAGSICSHFPFGIETTTPVPKKRSSARSPTACFSGKRWIGAFTCVEVWKMVLILCVITPCLA